MEVGKHLGIVKGKANSRRCYHKNIREICGRPMIHWTLDVAVKSEVLDKVIVSTIHDGADEVKDVVHAYDPDIDVFVRNGNDPAQIECQAFDYTVANYPGFKFCTGIFATSWFVRPSWIRAADKVLRSVRMFPGKNDYPVTNVVAFPGTPSDHISSWRLETREWNQTFYLELRSCVFDIDTESEFAQSEKVMGALLDTDYFEPENIHLHPDQWKKALEWNRIRI